MALPTRARPSFSHSQPLPSGSLHKTLILIHQSTAAAAKSLQSCPTLCDPIDSSPPGFPSLGFSRQEHWSGLPFLLPLFYFLKQPDAAQSRASASAQRMLCRRILTTQGRMIMRRLDRIFFQK